jgi:hypothetical protein
VCVTAFDYKNWSFATRALIPVVDYFCIPSRVLSTLGFLKLKDELHSVRYYRTQMTYSLLCHTLYFERSFFVGLVQNKPGTQQRVSSIITYRQ